MYWYQMKKLIKIYVKKDNFGFAITTFLILDGDVPLAEFFGVYIFVRFASICVDKHKMI